MTDKEQISHLALEIGAIKVALSVLICGQLPDPEKIAILTAFARDTAAIASKPEDGSVVRLHQNRYDENVELWRRAAEFLESVEHMPREMIKAAGGANDPR